MSKAIAKITVRCPHCSAQQQEPTLAKSTFCRRCSEYFAITPASLADAAPRATAQKPVEAANRWTGASAPVAPVVPAAPTFGGGRVSAAPPPATAVEPVSGLLGRIEGLFGGKPKVQVARCFECTGWHEVSGTAQSSTCKACGAYIDLQDYKVTGSFSRNIKTRGTLYVSSRGDLSSSKIVCSQATIHGRMRGNLTCSGKVTIRVQGKIFGSVEAGSLVVEKGSEVAFMRPVNADTAEIHGRVNALIVANGQVTISKSGLLEGAVSAACFSVETGGCFQGELTIMPRRAAATADAPAAPSASPADAAEAGLLGGDRSPALG